MDLYPLLSILHPYTDIFELPAYTDEKRIQIAALNCHRIALFITKHLTNQECIIQEQKCIPYDVFQYDYSSGLLEHETSYQSIAQQPEPLFSLYFSINHLVLKTPIDDIITTLIHPTAIRNRYLFFHVGLESYLNDIRTAHSCVFVIDNWLKTQDGKRHIYLLDPNGYTRSFASGRYNECETALGILFSKYDLIYKRQAIFDPIGLNGQLGDIMLIEGGNCVMISFLLIDLLFSTQESIQDIYQKLKTINKTELEQISLIYGSAIYNKLCYAQQDI